MKILPTTLAAALLAATAAAQAADLKAGQKIAEQQCAACHGMNGNSDNPLYPKLGGQHADYMERALADYASGARENALMVGFASALSAADRRNVAAWFASQADGVHTVGTD